MAAARPASSPPGPATTLPRRRPGRPRTQVLSGAALEEQLRHVQRLVMQGELAATAVHEISNLLTIVMFNAGLLRMRHAEDTAVLKYVEPILHATDVIGSLCTQLRNLSRPTPAQLRVVDLGEIARRTFTLLEQIMQRELVLETEGGRPVLICADPAHLDQIIVNLVLNARDATENTDGRIAIRLGHLTTTGVPYLEVRDNGTGMTPLVKRQIFKAFFTTKPVGRGTGLGLVTVRRLMQGMGGTIKLTSKPGQGTSIRLLFPSPPADAVAQYQSFQAEAPVPGPPG
jgi:two-component system cell cycle sensor histidine kinase/response regulator CckA